MRRFRLLLSLLLGLSLMTQGMAVAVAATSPMQMQMTAAEMAEMADMDMSADDHAMPCMDMDMSDQGAPAKCPAKCCDGKVCFDMSRCAQAQPAMASFHLPVLYSDAEHNAPVTLALAPAETPPTSLLRPPITFHS